MTQRNPMNERYQSEDRKGATRKSAASAKPVSKAASSVRIQSTKKTPQQKKAERKQQRAKNAERDRRGGKNTDDRVCRLPRAAAHERK